MLSLSIEPHNVLVQLVQDEDVAGIINGDIDDLAEDLVRGAIDLADSRCRGCALRNGATMSYRNGGDRN